MITEVYTHQVPCIRSISFRNIKNNRVGKGQIKTSDYFGNKMNLEFEFHLYDFKDGHLILRWDGHEQIVKVLYYQTYNLRVFACPLGCGRYTTELYFFNKSEWGCCKCLGLKRERSFLRARNLARNPEKLFRFLNNAKRNVKKSVGIAAYYIMQELFFKALKRKKRTLKNIKIN